MLLKEGDAVAVRDGSRGLEYFKVLGDSVDARTSPSWLSRDGKQLSGLIQRLPERAEMDGFLNEQLIVEYYSR
jgi:small subunit ribosomal protein S4